MNLKHCILFTLFILCLGCKAQPRQQDEVGVPDVAVETDQAIVTGDARTALYYPQLTGKRVALFGNHTALLPDGEHLLDRLISDSIRVTALFSPEHGFRGTADAGEHVSSNVDSKTGIPILSLYDGKTTRPSSASMRQFDVLLVDIQDVGLRYYTYYITMCRLLQACADEQKPVIILDRPNPNGHLVDGPILDLRYKSGVGLLPIPILHGMTLGELAKMAIGEGWLSMRHPLQLTVIPCAGYTHHTPYVLQVPPSPNLPNMRAVYLYPSLCYFEATPVSVGRGTDHPFQLYGHPQMKGRAFTFTPESRPGAKTPPLLGKQCQGVDLTGLSESELYSKGIDLSYLIDAYRDLGMGDKFFTDFFEKLVGVSWVRQMIQQGSSADDIRARWQGDVQRFKEQRKPYLMYEEGGGS